MATTTPNYGWAVPTSSDLVKNGATAIETLGDSIDASLVDLRGGTVGQSLIKASSTEMDFAWASTPSASNPVLNSTMQVAQRGTSFTAGGYSLDRWYMNGAANMTVSRQATGDTTNLPFIQYCARVARNVSSTSTADREFTQSFESVNSIPFAGKTVTVSFYARKGANYSSTSDALSFLLISGTGTDQNRGTGSYTGEAYPASVTATLTTTWQRFTATGTVAATATELATYFVNTPVGTAGAADYFEVTGVQLDVGSVALPFRTYAATIQGELAACQRYYYVHASGNALSIGNAGYYTASQVNGMVQFPVSMRTAPSLVATTGTDYYIADRNGGSDTLNSFTIYRPTATTAMLYNNTEASGTAGHAALYYTNNASSSVAFSSEL
jgi:hypothetical protein